MNAHCLQEALRELRHDLARATDERVTEVRAAAEARVREIKSTQEALLAEKAARVEYLESELRRVRDDNVRLTQQLCEAMQTKLQLNGACSMNPLP